MTIREYRVQDFEQLIALYKNTHSYGGNFDPDRDDATKLEATSKAGNLFVVIDGAELLGSIMILDNPHTFWLLRFVVKDNNHEVAEMLAAKTKQTAKDREHTSIIVYTDPESDELNARYSKLGFNGSQNYKCFWAEV